MKLKPLGRTDLRVTELCLGTMTWGSQNTEAEGHAQIDLALEAGLNFMDTAELYAVPGSPETSGRTEEIIGNWFQNTGKRDAWILASKIGGGGSKFLRDGGRADGKSSALRSRGACAGSRPSISISSRSIGHRAAAIISTTAGPMRPIPRTPPIPRPTWSSC